MTGAHDLPDLPLDPVPAPRPAAESVAFQSLSRRHEAERSAVASALHNRIGQSLSAMKMSAHLALDEPDAGQRREDLAEVLRMADEAVAELRELEATLFPPQLRELGLEAALRGEVERLPASASCAVALEFTDVDVRFAPELEIACFRSAQQLLAHALGPAGATRAVLSLRPAEGRRLVLELAHDGHGFDGGRPPDAATLAVLRARSEAFGGSFANAARAPWPCSSRMVFPHVPLDATDSWK